MRRMVLLCATAVIVCTAVAQAPSAGAKSCRITLRSPVVEPMPIVVNLCPAE